MSAEYAKAVTEFKAGSAEMAASTAPLKARLKELEQQVRDVEKAIKDNNIAAGTPAHAVLAKQMQDAAAEASKLRTQLEQTNQKVKEHGDAQRNTEAEIRKTIRGHQEQAAALRAVGDVMTIAVTAPIVAATGAAVHFAASFETELNKVRTLAGASGQEISWLHDQVLKLAPAVGVGPAELARGLFSIESAGFRGAQAMEVLDRAAKMSAQGMGDVQTLARTITAAMLDFHTQGMTAAKAADILVATVQRGNMPIDSLHGALGRVNAMASSVGVSFEQVGAAIATFTHMGVSASEAVTGLRAILMNLEAPSKRTREAFAELGTSVAEMREKIKTDLAGTLVSLIQQSGGNLDALHELIPNVRGLAEAIAIAKQNGTLYADNLKYIQTAHGLLDANMVETKKTFGQMWNEFKADLEVAANAIGETLLPKLKALLPAFKDVIEVVVTLAGWFAKMPTLVQDFALITIGIIAVGGPLLSAIGRIGLAWTTVERAILAARDAEIAFTLAGLGTAAGKFAAGAAGFALPAAGAAAGVGAAAYGFDQFMQWWSDLANKIKGGMFKVGGGGGIPSTSPNDFQFVGPVFSDSEIAARALERLNASLERHKVVLAEAARKAKEFSDAWVEANSLGSTFVETLAGLNPKLRDNAVYYASIGAEASLLVKMFPGLTMQQAEAAKAQAEFNKHLREHTGLLKEIIGLSGPLKGLPLYNIKGDIKDFTELDVAMTRLMNTTRNGMLGPISGMPLIKPGAEIDWSKFVQVQGLTDIGQKFRDMLMNIPQLLQQAFTGGGGLTGGLKAIGSMLGSELLGGFATRIMETSGSNFWDGTLGKLFGAAMPIIGALAGPLIGAIIKLFDHTKSDIARRAGTEFGMEFSAALLDAITKDVKAGMSQVAATLKHLPEIIAEAGGVQAFGVDKAIEKMRDLFVMIGTGQMTFKEAGAVFEKVFAQVMPEAIDKFTGLAKQSFLELIRLARDFGLTSQAVLDFMNKQLNTVVDAFIKLAKAILGPALDAFDKLQKGGAADVDKLKKILADFAEGGQEQFDRLARYAVAAFAAALAAGMTFWQAMNKLGPTLDLMRQAMEKLGLAASATLADLLKWREWAKDNQDLLDQLDAMVQLFAAMANAGMVNKNVFADMAADALAMFKRLRESGLSEIDALRVMAPLLQILWDLARRLGIELEGDLKRLIELALAAGLIGEDHQDPQTIMVERLTEIRDILKAIRDYFGAGSGTGTGTGGTGNGTGEGGPGRPPGGRIPMFTGFGLDEMAAVIAVWRELDELVTRVNGTIGFDLQESARGATAALDLMARAGVAAGDDMIMLGDDGYVALQKIRVSGDAAARAVNGLALSAISAFDELTRLSSQTFAVNFQFGAGAPPTSGGGGGSTIVPMAGGGSGRVTRPTLFLAGKDGPEDFAFSGENRRFGGRAGGDVYLAVVDGRPMRITREQFDEIQAALDAKVLRVPADSVMDRT